MATVAEKLTLERFREQYECNDRAYEYWYGEAIPKSVPTIVHGLLQGIIMLLLREAGFISASEVELRIEEGAHPKPDVLATKTPPRGEYPTTAWDVVVEIVSRGDDYSMLRAKCAKYQAWNFAAIYVVDPSDQSVVQWKDGGLIPVLELASIPVERIWKQLDEQYAGR